MRSLLTCLATSLLITASIAQETQSEILQVPANIVCTDLDTVTNFTNENGEIPFASMVSMIAIGKESQWPGNEAPSVMFVNPKKLSWTIVTKIAEGAYCVTASGIYMTPASSQGVGNPLHDKLEAPSVKSNWQNSAKLTELRD